MYFKVETIGDIFDQRPHKKVNIGYAFGVFKRTISLSSHNIFFGLEIKQLIVGTHS